MNVSTDTRFAENQPDRCRVCHGNNGEGTVLSRVATSRRFIIEERENGCLCSGGEIQNFEVSLKKEAK